ncbi:MAG: endonuclease, partial [Flammeovirgaceae bacterium]
MKKSVLLVVAFCLNVAVFAQSYPPNGLDGSALRTWLKSNWYDGFHSNLGYDNARIAMYDRIDKAADGDVYCVYTGFHQPSQNTTFLNPINAEHTVPQSWFNQANPMRSDIHHLFPTHMNVNSSRGSLPFAEIPDNQTDNWYIVNSSNTGITTSSSIPSSNIDAYSERNTNVSFEVREDHKGNTARAIFYFYTMYPTQAGSIDEIGDINELYQWHLDDPVDAWEQQRNARTKDEQGNFNPYISHPELVARAWGFAPIPTVDFEAMTGTISEGNSGSQTYQITVEASSAPSSAVTMNIAVDASSTATAGVDFTLSTTSVTLTNSNFSKTVSVNILGDTDFENNETIVLKLQNLSGDATLGDDTHTITITNDDAQPEINFTASSGDETEGNSGTKTYQTMVSISPAPLSAVTVDVEVVGGTATENVDYTLSTSTLTFNNSTTSQPVSITINGDTEFEGDETVILDLENISGSANLGSNASHTLTITNDDTQPAISFNAATGSIEEGNSGTKSYETTVNISPAPTEEITVAVGAGSGTAISGTDYTLSTTSLTFNSTTTSQTVTVMIQGDEDAESDETVVLELANVTGNATLGTTTAHTLTIANDDAPCTEPSTAASALTPSAVTMTTATLSWTAGNGESRLVLMKSGSDFTASDLPVNGNTYAASASFGDGASIGSAFVVFNGTGNSVDVSNLAMNTTYFVQVIEYACSPILYKASGNATTEFTSADFAAAT